MDSQWWLNVTGTNKNKFPFGSLKQAVMSPRFLAIAQCVVPVKNIASLVMSSVMIVTQTIDLFALEF